LAWQGMARPGEARHGSARQGVARHGGAKAPYNYKEMKKHGRI